MLATEPGWGLDVQRGPDWLLVRVSSGDEGDSGTYPLADSLWALCERHFTYRLVLELDQIGLLNSHLIGQLVQLYKRISEHDGVLRLCGLSAYNLRVLEVCQLKGHFPAYHDRQEAVRGSCCPNQPR